MAPAAAFSQVLEQFVDRYESGEPAAAGRWHPGVATRPLLWLEDTGLSARPVAATPSPVRPEPRPKRLLSSSQRDALEQLTALGARLRADFTREELRSAFRSLARAYHPDHHPGIPASEKARLSAMFASVRSAYVVLRPLP
jgi:hypothetical protein